MGIAVRRVATRGSVAMTLRIDVHEIDIGIGPVPVSALAGRRSAAAVPGVDSAGHQYQPGSARALGHCTAVPCPTRNRTRTATGTAAIPGIGRSTLRLFPGAANKSHKSQLTIPKIAQDRRCQLSQLCGRRPGADSRPGRFLLASTPEAWLALEGHSLPA
jgi:hypothetical protein